MKFLRSRSDCILVNFASCVFSNRLIAREGSSDMFSFRPSTPIFELIEHRYQKCWIQQRLLEYTEDSKHHKHKASHVAASNAAVASGQRRTDQALILRQTNWWKNL